MDASFFQFLGIGLAVVAALAIALGFISYRGMIHYRMRDEAYQRQSALDSGDFDASAIDLPWIEEDVVSPGGYTLRVHAIGALCDGVAQRDGSGSGVAQRKVAVFHHGIGWGWLGMIRYMEIFRAAGWSVVAYDSRGHGRSGGGRPSYGYYEKADLRAVLDWAAGADGREGRFACDEGLLLFGESMGAATVLQYAPLDPRLDAVIADCPYSSALGELKARLRAIGLPPGLRGLVAAVADLFCRRIEGFSLRDADPSAAILETDLPILLIHGSEDRFVPADMSRAMLESRRARLPSAITELYIAEGARHAQSIRANKARYVAVLAAFVEEAMVYKKGSRA